MLSAALAAAGSAAAPSIGRVAVTLEIVEHGKTVRTVHANATVQAAVEDQRRWLKPGYWEVDLRGKDLPTTKALCKPTLCVDSEPGNELLNPPFENLHALTTVVGPSKRRILLTGSVPIHGRGSIAWLEAWNWYSRNDAQGIGFVYMPAPVGVVPGQQARFTVVLTFPPARS